MTLPIRRRYSRTPLTLVLFLLAVLIAAPLAWAHTHPEKMEPAADSTVASPAAVTIHFSGDLEPKFSSITITDAGGHVANKQPATVGPDPKTMMVPLPALTPGIYTVTWVGVSLDTHRSQGDYKFTVK